MRRYQTLPGHTLADIAVQEFGDLSTLSVIANANGLAVDAELEEGAVILLPDLERKEQATPLRPEERTKTVLGDLEEKVILASQSLIDLAIQEYGSPEGVATLLADNPSLNIDSNPDAGTRYLVRRSLAEQTGKRWAQVLRNQQVLVGTMDPQPPIELGEFNDDYSNDYKRR